MYDFDSVVSFFVNCSKKEFVLLPFSREYSTSNLFLFGLRLLKQMKLVSIGILIVFLFRLFKFILVMLFTVIINNYYQPFYDALLFLIVDLINCLAQLVNK